MTKSLTYLAEVHTYQLRAYMYQARDLFSEDASGLSDPYARVIFGNHSKATKIIPETLCPTWDQVRVLLLRKVIIAHSTPPQSYLEGSNNPLLQTIILERLELYGDPEKIVKQPPSIIIELFDYDPVVSGYGGINHTPTLLNSSRSGNLEVGTNRYTCRVTTSWAERQLSRTLSSSATTLRRAS